MEYDDSAGYDQSSGGDRKPAPPAKQALSPEQFERLATDCGGLWSPAQIARIYDEMGGWCGDGDLAKFLYVCVKRNLDPLLGEVHAEFRWDKRKSQWQMATIIHIDALRKLADLTKQYDGQDEPVFMTDAKGQLMACTVRIYRKDCSHPFAATCYFAEYNTGWGNWKKMPHVMLGKCTEAAAHRKAFPAALSGVYIPEEMGRADYSAEPEAPAAAATPEPDGLAVGRKPNGAPAPVEVPPSVAEEPTKNKPKPDKASALRERFNAAKREIARRAGIKPQEATVCINTFMRTYFDAETLPTDPTVYAGPLDILEKLISDDKGQSLASLGSLVKDPVTAARSADPLEALFTQWNWQPLTRTAARQTRAKLKINPEQFVLWISSVLKLENLPDKDVLAFFALATYSNQAHRALALARATQQSVSNVVHAVEVNLGGDKDFSQATEAELTAAIESVERLSPPLDDDGVPTEEEPAEAR